MDHLVEQKNIYMDKYSVHCYKFKSAKYIGMSESGFEWYYWLWMQVLDNANSNNVSESSFRITFCSYEQLCGSQNETPANLPSSTFVSVALLSGLICLEQADGRQAD